MLRGFPSIDKTWSTQESLNAVGTVKKSMSNNAFLDLYCCLHFTDDWGEEEGVEWDDIYLDVNHTSPELARHHRKLGDVEDAFNNWWKEWLTFGKWLTFGESRLAGWYHSPITCGPEPKPIRTGETIHAIYVTKGTLASYKVHVHVYGGKSDKDLLQTSTHTGTVQKWVNLLEEILNAF